MLLFDDDDGRRSRDPAAGRELDVRLVLHPDQRECVVIPPALEDLGRKPSARRESPDVGEWKNRSVGRCATSPFCTVVV
jgi:hypothetical protein